MESESDSPGQPGTTNTEKKLFHPNIFNRLAAVAHADFKLLYPGPRGVFVEANEGLFCGGYPNATTNRTTFPLNDANFIVSSEHYNWTMQVTISASSNASNFSDFSSTPVKRNFTQGNPGDYCFPINIGAAGVSGVTDGSNVTISVIFDDGEDGLLYQCADLTLSRAATFSNSSLPSGVTCRNVSEVSTTNGTTHSGTTAVRGHDMSASHLFAIVAVALMVVAAS